MILQLICEKIGDSYISIFFFENIFKLFLNISKIIIRNKKPIINYKCKNYKQSIKRNSHSENNTKMINNL